MMDDDIEIGIDFKGNWEVFKNETKEYISLEEDMNHNANNYSNQKINWSKIIEQISISAIDKQMTSLAQGIIAPLKDLSQISNALQFQNNISYNSNAIANTVKDILSSHVNVNVISLQQYFENKYVYCIDTVNQSRQLVIHIYFCDSDEWTRTYVVNSNDQSKFQCNRFCTTTKLFNTVQNQHSIYIIGGQSQKDIRIFEQNVYQVKLFQQFPSEIQQVSKAYPMAQTNGKFAMSHAIPYKNKIFLFGGFTKDIDSQHESVTTSCEVYDTINNTWTVKQSMKIPLICYNFAADLDTGALIVFGGYTETNSQKQQALGIEFFNLEQMNWIGRYQQAYCGLPDNTTFFTARGFGFFKQPHQLGCFGGRQIDQQVNPSYSRESGERLKYYSQFCLHSSIHSINPVMVNSQGSANAVDDSQISDYLPAQYGNKYYFAHFQNNMPKIIIYDDFQQQPFKSQAR
eukprot:TRINITY_DN3253_c0_g2_i3.p1 TRINITY_DN3253_c0_g2~~TRINITY_DN3253_c0_g2_i3.p1  ORF type:complete len:458 (+),score=68.02 TRINITY_DN3253_c0_g2_i3:150-1523(+)